MCSKSLFEGVGFHQFPSSTSAGDLPAYASAHVRLRGRSCRLPEKLGKPLFPLASERGLNSEYKTAGLSKIQQTFQLARYLKLSFFPLTIFRCSTCEASKYYKLQLFKFASSKKSAENTPIPKRHPGILDGFQVRQVPSALLLLQRLSA